MPDDAYMPKWTGLVFIQVIACHQLSAEPLFVVHVTLEHKI